MSHHDLVLFSPEEEPFGSPYLAYTRFLHYSGNHFFSKGINEMADYWAIWSVVPTRAKEGDIG